MNKDKIKVKYLNQEDIESLGLKFSVDFIHENERVFVYDLKKEGYKLLLNTNQHYIEIFKQSNESKNTFVPIIKLNIKNKLELTELLQQLNIN